MSSSLLTCIHHHQQQQQHWHNIQFMVKLQARESLSIVSLSLFQQTCHNWREAFNKLLSLFAACITKDTVMRITQNTLEKGWIESWCVNEIKPIVIIYAITCISEKSFAIIYTWKQLTLKFIETVPSQDTFQLFCCRREETLNCFLLCQARCTCLWSPSSVRLEATWCIFHDFSVALFACIGRHSVTIYACTTFLLTGSLINCANTAHLKAHYITRLSWLAH